MNNKYVTHRLESICCSWISFIFVFIFFYIIGDVIIGWWHGAWWIWLIIGIFLFGAISSTIKFLFNIFVYKGQTKIENFLQEKNKANNISSNVQSQTATNDSVFKTTNNVVHYCKNCGVAIDGSEQYCPSCGVQI